MKNMRLISANIIDEVTQGNSLSDSLETTLVSIKDVRDKAFVQAICYGVCRFYPRLDVMLSKLLDKPLREKDSDVHALLLIGIYQLWAMRIPDYAAVTETVNAVESLKKSWARGLVNAVLRNYLRQREEIEKEIQDDIEAHYSHPDWWIDSIKNSWPSHWQTILNANNEHPPFSLRINQQQISREKYLEKLQQENFAANIISQTNNGIILEDAIQVEELPGFSAGMISVQDGGAQLACELLQLQSHQHVLDACAAPGGKLTHMLEIQNDISVVAVEKNKKRIIPIKKNLARLNLNAECICADAANINTWWDKKLFDRILLDAPCSASGVIRRHPDIKLLRQPSDISALANEQLHLLKSLWPLLKPGGLFLYSTCSIFPEENVDVINQFFSETTNVMEEKIQTEWGHDCEIGKQILPGENQMDGFYYALLRKV